MAECRYCGEHIDWKHNPDEMVDGRSGWIPMDPETGERHQCGDQEVFKECWDCGKPIVLKKVGKKWKPFNEGLGTPHKCEED